MNKALRQFLVFFILICIIVLAVLVVQVFIFGEKADPEMMIPSAVESETTISESPPPMTQNTAPPITTPQETEESTPDVTDNDEPSGPPEGMERVTLPLPGIGDLNIDYFPDIFEHNEHDSDDRFLYISPEGGSASMSVLVRSDMTAADAPRFFDDAEPDQTVSGGAQSIGRTGLTGQHVKALLGDTTYEAWLVDINGGVAAFSINYVDELQKEALYNLIDTMRLK